MYCQLGLFTRGSSPPTCLSDSFSSFSSFSFALTAASAFLSTVRFSHEDWFALGRNALLLSCHCLPAEVVRSQYRGYRVCRIPFFFMPFTAAVSVAAGAWVTTASDMFVMLRRPVEQSERSLERRRKKS
jgi:hypothetical protein